MRNLEGHHRHEQRYRGEKGFLGHRELHTISCYWNKEFNLGSGRLGKRETYHRDLVWQPREI